MFLFKVMKTFFLQMPETSSKGHIELTPGDLVDLFEKDTQSTGSQVVHTSQLAALSSQEEKIKTLYLIVSTQ